MITTMSVVRFFSQCHHAIVLFLLARTTSAFSFTSSNFADTIIRSYSLHGNGIDSTKCILHEVRPTPRDPNTEEDNVELFYPTIRRSFLASPNSNAHIITAEKSKPLTIRQTSFGCGRLGATVWPSAIALAALLADESSHGVQLQGARVMELGSGCGLPSLVAKEVCNAGHVLATDYWEDHDGSSDGRGDRLVPKNLFGENLVYNIGASSTGSADTSEDAITNTCSATCSVKKLDWHDEMGIFKISNEFRPNVIIGSDLVYYPMDTSPLLQALEILLKNSSGDTANNNSNDDDDGNKKVKAVVDALLLLPLPPNAEREALPDFRKRLENGELGVGCEVTLDELEMVGSRVGDNSEGHEDVERHNFLRVRIRHSQ